MSFRRSAALAAFTTVVVAITLILPAQAASPATFEKAPPTFEKVPEATGYGGAVATVDADATRVAIDVLREGGNAVDAAVAAAATLGVTEPFSAGVGGGGFFLFYDARSRRVSTIDGRESAPATATETMFVNPATGLPYAFQEARVSGLSVGVPGTPRTWDAALRRWGTMSMAEALRPAIEIARQGFVVDATFNSQVADNLTAFGQFSSTRALYLPGGAPPAVGSVFRNPELAETYSQIARRGVRAFYRGDIARDIVSTVQDPPLAEPPVPPWAFPIRPGEMRLSDLSRYDVQFPRPTQVDYRGLQVYGMPPPSSGGSTVGEALNILENFELDTDVARASVAPLSRGERPRLRRPQPVRGRRHAAASPRRAALGRLRARARVPDRPGRGADQAGGAGDP